MVFAKLSSMSVVHLVVQFGFVSVALAATIPLNSGPPACDRNTGIGCLPSPKDCPEGCTCNRTDLEYETEVESLERPSEKQEFKFVRTVTYYGSAGLSDDEELAEDSITTKIHERVQYVFRGIIVSAILFIACACACVVSVCLYCCHIRRTDRKLREEVESLAKKLKVDVRIKAGPSRRPPIAPVAESCNVIVQDANVLCV